MRKADEYRCPTARSPTPLRDGGASLGQVRLEVFLGFFVFGLAVLGAGFAAISGYGAARNGQQDLRAERAAAAAAAEFEAAAGADFDAALLAFDGRDRRAGDMRVRCAIVLDETAFETPVDLNGDGDRSDTGLQPEECEAGYLRTTVTFADGATHAFLCAVLRGNYREGGVSQDVLVRDARVTAERLRADLELTRKIEVVGMRIEAALECGIVEVRINGKVVAHEATPKSMGESLSVRPFALSAGANEIDEIRLVADDPVAVTDSFRVILVEATGVETEFVLRNRPAPGSSLGIASSYR